MSASFSYNSLVLSCFLRSFFVNDDEFRRDEPLYLGFEILKITVVFEVFIKMDNPNKKSAAQWALFLFLQG